MHEIPSSNPSLLARWTWAGLTAQRAWLQAKDVEVRKRIAWNLAMAHLLQVKLRLGLPPKGRGWETMVSRSGCNCIGLARARGVKASF